MSDPIRLLFLIGSLGGGGSERQLVALLNQLDRQQFRAAVYLLHREGELLSELPRNIPIESFREQRGEKTGLRVPGQAFWRQQKHLREAVQRNQIDIVCERNWEMTMLSAAACRNINVRRVAVIGSHPARDLATRGGRFGWIKKRLLRRAYQQADRIVAVSDGVRRNAIDYYHLVEEQALTIHSAVDPPRIDRRAFEFAAELPPGRFHIVSVGRLQEEKGYSYLLEALAQLVQREATQHVMLTIIGQGPLESRLKKQVQETKLTEHVQFLGYLTNPIPYLRAADLYCLPSLFEGMPNALEEAVICGTPVLATDCDSGPAEILDGGRLGHLVPPGDAHALAIAISDAIENHDPWKQRTKAAREFVSQHFALAVGAQKYADLFQEVASD